MRSRIRARLWVGVGVGVVWMAPAALALEPAGAGVHVDVLFSPEGGCEERVVQELGRARKTIRVQAYTFTSSIVARALSDARARGVDCEVILDKWNRTEKFSAARSIFNAGIPCFIDDSHTIANNKVILVDDATLLTGSYNFTRAAEASNAENLLIITGMPDLMKAYAGNYAKHRQHAKPYVPVSATQPAITGEAVASEDVVNPGPASGGKVYVTPNGKKYHRANCEFLRRRGEGDRPLRDSRQVHALFKVHALTVRIVWLSCANVDAQSRERNWPVRTRRLRSSPDNARHQSVLGMTVHSPVHAPGVARDAARQERRMIDPAGTDKSVFVGAAAPEHAQKQTCACHSWTFTV